MSQEHYESLQKTKKVSATSETFISPTKSFSEDYKGVTVKLDVNDGTTAKLEQIGVKDSSKRTRVKYPEMPGVSKGWAGENALFKAEGNQINIGLGKGKALETFNENISSFEKVGCR